MKFSGVGRKVADCVLLYSGTRYDVFPTDVWVKRVMEELYFGEKSSFDKIQEFAASKFGELSGFAQQYLFYYARENRIGTVTNRKYPQ
jgi:N-glycosylase/DNA lyase